MSEQDFSKEKTETITDLALYERFVGPNASHYIIRWDSMKDRIWSWNWSAFFFAEGWLLYRKMYFYAIIYSLIRISITPFFASLAFADGLPNLFFLAVQPHTLVINVVLGLIADHLYKVHADKKIAAAKSIIKPEHLLLGVSSKGGVSLISLLLIPVIAIIEHLTLFLFNNDLNVNWTETYQTFSGGL